MLNPWTRMFLLSEARVYFCSFCRVPGNRCCSLFHARIRVTEDFCVDSDCTESFTKIQIDTISPLLRERDQPR
jgi:hypothetical protein